MDRSGASYAQPTIGLDALDREVLEQVFVQDGGASLDILNSHRQQLGLGPSRNLISSEAFAFSSKHAGNGSGNDDPRRQRVEDPQFPLKEISDLPHQNNLENLRRLRHSHIANSSRQNSQPDPPHSSSNEGQLHLAGKYYGNRALSRNRSADIPEEMNCRLWIVGLPPRCTVKELLQNIRGIGPIYATHLVPPIINEERPSKNRFSSAASLTFFTVSDTNKFLQRYHPFVVGGYVTTVLRHRIRTRPFSVDGQSRVVVIKGRPDIVTPRYLNWVFTEEWNIRFDTDFMEYRPGQDSSKIVWGFGSFRAQAQAVYLLLARQFEGFVTVSYGWDPCA